AFARTVSINAYNKTGAQIINNSTLTVGDLLVAFNDGALNNFGVVSVGGQLELLNQSSLQNSGLITLGQGGDFKDQSTVSNTITGTIEVAGGTLNVLVDVANSGQLAIDPGATLALNGSTVTGGTVTDNGAIHVTGNSAINTAAVNGGQVTVDTTKTLTLDNTTVTGTTIADNGTVKVDATKTLNLSGAALSGGAISNLGIIDIIGSSSITNHAFTNTGATLIVDSGITLTLNGTTI